ncbi:hypothetical protein BH11BAC2_BH11BAC2_11070 [soil metagenome]
MSPSEIQHTFFNLIKVHLPAHLSLVDEIAGLLDLSNDSAYRRIRGEKELSLHEIQLLALHYKISLDQLMGMQSNAILFHGDLLDRNTFSFETYLQSMLQNLKNIAAMPNRHFYFEAKDIPPFHHFQFPMMAAFKYFFWMRIIMQDFNLSKKIFDPQEFKGQLDQDGIGIGKLYTSIPSSELWNLDTLNGTMRQIEFCVETGMFDNKIVRRSIYEDLMQMIEHIEMQATVGKKFMLGEIPDEKSGPFNLYINEVNLGHNTMLVTNDIQPVVFINHNVLNFMVTYDQRFCQYSGGMMQNIISKSSLISGVNHKDRTKFFNVLKGKVAEKMH